MRIGLIQPWPVMENWRGKKSVFVFPPLSLIQLAAVTPSRHRLEIYDETNRQIDLNGPFDVVGISVTTPAANRAYQLASHFRNRGIPVVLGGIHPSVCPSEASQHADAIAIGEGERIWQQILRDVECGSLQRVYKANNALKPEEIPSGDRSWIRPGEYFIPETIQATRGCPWHCSFCSSATLWGRNVRCRPIEHVIREIAAFKRRFFVFLDDNLFAVRDYAAQLMTRLKPLNKRWVAQTDLKLSEHEQLIRSARRSGCLAVLVGLESNNPLNLLDIHKGLANADEYRRSIVALHQHGILVQGSFILGFDGDTNESVLGLLEFCERLGLDTANFSILTPFPGTATYSRFKREHRLLSSNWDHYNREDVVFRSSSLSPQQLIELRLHLYRRFYSWTSIRRRIPRTWRHIPLYFVYNFSYRAGIANLERKFRQQISVI